MRDYFKNNNKVEGLFFKKIIKLRDYFLTAKIHHLIVATKMINRDKFEDYLENKKIRAKSKIGISLGTKKIFKPLLKFEVGGLLTLVIGLGHITYGGK